MAKQTEEEVLIFLTKTQMIAINAIILHTLGAASTKIQKNGSGREIAQFLDDCLVDVMRRFSEATGARGEPKHV